MFLKEISGKITCSFLISVVILQSASLRLCLRRTRCEGGQPLFGKRGKQNRHGQQGATLPETNSSHLKIGRNPIGKACIPTIHFQGAIAVSFREATYKEGSVDLLIPFPKQLEGAGNRADSISILKHLEFSSEKTTFLLRVDLCRPEEILVTRCINRNYEIIMGICFLNQDKIRYFGQRYFLVFWLNLI